MKAFIAVEAIIGVGKSTFTRALASHLQINGHPGTIAQFEPVDSNPYLEMFYKDMRRWAFSMQMFLLHSRYRMHQQAATSDVTVIQDRSLFGDICFGRLAHKLGNMTDMEMRTYEMARENMMMHMVYPDLVIYLDISAGQAHRRIKSRTQTGDDGIPLEYLEGLRHEYERMIAQLGQHCPVYRVAWTDFSDTAIQDRVADTWDVAKERLSEDWCRRQGWGG